MEDLFSFSSRSNKNWTGKETPVLDNTQMVAAGQRKDSTQRPENNAKPLSENRKKKNKVLKVATLLSYEKSKGRTS